MTKAPHEDNVVRTANRIEEEAALWLVRSDARNDPEEWARLDAWLSKSTRHRAAFLRLSVAWRRADVLRKLVRLSGEVDDELLNPARWAGFERLHVEALVPPAPALPRRRALAWFSFPMMKTATAIVLALALGVAAWWGFGDLRPTRYVTGVGEFRRVTLEDGSVIGLNTASEIRVRFSAHQRRIQLVRGEALFTVAHDASRPFDVSAGTLVVRAVGTEFSVRLRDPQSLDLLVSEGRVALNPPSATTLAAGTAAALREGRLTLETLTPGDITRRLSWTSGRLAFQSATLASMADEFNRYNSRRLLIYDPDLARQRFGGTFRATDPNAFASALEHTFNIKVRHLAGVDGTDVLRLDPGVP